VDNGELDATIKYSPAYLLQVFHHGDKIIAIDGVSLQGLSNEVVWALCAGTAGTIAHIEYKRGSEIKTVDVQRKEYPSLNGLDKLTAKQKFELGAQLREVSSMSAAFIALVQAKSMDPTGEAGILAAKVLQCRMPRFQAPPRAWAIYNVAYRCRINGDLVKAEALFRYMIKEWPQYEWPREYPFPSSQHPQVDRWRLKASSYIDLM
jgi:hypothetical protein